MVCENLIKERYLLMVFNIEQKVLKLFAATLNHDKYSMHQNFKIEQ